MMVQMSVVVGYTPVQGLPTMTMIFRRDVSADLPADAIGEMMVDVLQEVHRETGVGADLLTIVVSFQYART